MRNNNYVNELPSFKGANPPSRETTGGSQLLGNTYRKIDNKEPDRNEACVRISGGQSLRSHLVLDV
eukprot:7568172-Heterocapsa_arctica.AAC.1